MTFNLVVLFYLMVTKGKSVMEVKETRTLANVRIYVERVIGQKYSSDKRIPFCKANCLLIL